MMEQAKLKSNKAKQSQRCGRRSHFSHKHFAHQRTYFMSPSNKDWCVTVEW